MIDIDLRITHHFLPGDLYMKEMHLPAGHYARTHTHRFDHQSVLLHGRVIVVVDGAEAEYEAPACVLIRAGSIHTITALEDAEWYCIHHTTETDPDRIDHTLIQEN